MRRLLLVLFLLASLTTVSAQTYIELILDASGSMWAKLEDGRYRIVGAKDALTELVRGLPASGDLNVGLRVYGSRSGALDAGACEDTELFVPLAGVDKAALQQTIDSVTAKGATPIAASLVAAAADFPDPNARRIIVLVTDGLESCGGDLNAVVADLKAAGIELRIIGFALPQSAADAFAQLASFENTASTAALTDALTDAVQEAVTEVAPEPEAAKVAQVTLDAPAEVGAGTAFQVTWSGERGDDDALVLTVATDPDDAAGRLLGYIGSKTAIDTVAPLDVGEYELRYLSGGTVAARHALAVTPSPATMQVVDDAVFAGAKFEVAWTGPNGPSDYITIVEPDAPDGKYGTYAYTKTGSPVGLVAPSQPGSYELRYQSDSEPGVVVARTAFEVMPPKPITLEAAHEVLQGGNVVVNWTGPDAQSDYITIAPADSPRGTYLDYKYTTAGSPITLRAPIRPGAYEIRYSTDRSDAKGEIYASAPLTVTAADIVLKPQADIRAGTRFSVEVEGPANSQDYITIVPAGAADGDYGSYAYVRQNGTFQLDAPDEPGAYEIRYQSDNDSSTVMGRVEVTVKAP